MGKDSKIQWTNHTFNPWRGCTKVSPGCANCYAETLSKRNPKVLGIWGPNGTRPQASESKWKEPIVWNRLAGQAGERHRVFCASLADVFEDREELAEPRERLFRLIDRTPNLDWLLLTKRPENISRLHPEPMPENVWLGVTVENRKHGLPRINILRSIPAAVRFLSIEPLIEGLGDIDLTGIDWVIIGGESGAHARPFDLDWARSLIRQCREQNVACFMKQFGARPFDPRRAEGIPGAKATWNVDELKNDPEKADNTAAIFDAICSAMMLDLNGSHGGDWDEWPEAFRVRELPKAMVTA